MSEYTEYWKETLSCSFDEMGIYDIWQSLNDDQKNSIANSIETSRGCMGMAFYTPPSTDVYSEREVQVLRNRISELEKELQEVTHSFTMNVARRRNCDPVNVVLGKNGDAEYR